MTGLSAGERNPGLFANGNPGTFAKGSGRPVFRCRGLSIDFRFRGEAARFFFTVKVYADYFF